MRGYRGLLIILTLSALAAAGCGSSGHSSAATTTPTTEATTTTVASTTTTFDQTAAQAQITANFAKFFNGADPNIAGRVALLQGGDNPALAALFTQASSGKNAAAAAQTYVKVTSIEFQAQSDCSDNGLNEPCALVNYNLYLKTDPTKPVLTEKGYAVLDGGVWKVATSTYCSLISLAGLKCPSS